MIRPFEFNEFLFLLTAVQWTLALSALAAVFFLVVDQVIQLGMRLLFGFG